MGLWYWIKRQFGDRSSSTRLVPFLDQASRRIVQIPVSELRPGMIQVQLQPSGNVVWALPDQFRQGEIRHPVFIEAVRDHIRRIQNVFAEHRSLSFEQWEDGFRRDARPEKQIAIWSHAADVYRAFADNEISPEKRKEFYRVILACLTSSRDSVWYVLQLEVLSRSEAETVIERFYWKDG
jgi:hypothetical protein